MKLSWNWLQEYVGLSATTPDEVATLLTMSGLNRDGVERVGDDVMLNVEVTSNRADCLGHIGVAREISVLLGLPLKTPAAEITSHENSESTEKATSVALECPDICSAYIARVIKGVKVGTSPQWLRNRLMTVGITPINSIVDVTNYVLMECGQPLHAFDFDKLDERRIVVRHGAEKEVMQAIDHHEYPLDPSTCVIADASRAVAIGGVMGGAGTEIGAGTVNVLIESARFDAMSIRATARRLKLHSDSSYRFERGVDDQRLDWASRRCCELILQIAGGELLEGSVLAGAIPDWSPEPITLRFPQVKRVLGIEIAIDEMVRILTALGLTLVSRDGETVSTWSPPSWRRDLVREVDLIEEIARIHGFENIPDNSSIPVVASTPSLHEQVTDKVRGVLLSAGLSEAMTYSFVPEPLTKLIEPVAGAVPLGISPPAGEYGQTMRTSLIPSLLRCRRDNERRGNLNVALFELSRVFLGTDPNEAGQQPIRLAWVSGQPFRETRGLVEAVTRSVSADAVLTLQPFDLPQFRSGRGAELILNGERWGWMGEIDREADTLRDWKLREEVCAVELDWQTLLSQSRLGRTSRPIPKFPAIERDLNFVLDEAVTWDRVEFIIRQSAGAHLTRVAFVDQYRGQHIPAGKKSYVVSLAYQSEDRTLTASEIDDAQQHVIAACQKEVAAVLR